MKREALASQALDASRTVVHEHGMRGDLLVLFPGALGDFICFLPTLLGLRSAHGSSITLVAKPGLLELVASSVVAPLSIDRVEISDLFVSAAEVRAETRALLGSRAAAYSWTGSRDPEFASRLASITAGPVRVVPFRGMEPHEHAVDYYARSAGVNAVSSVTAALRIDRRWFTEFAERHSLSGRRLLVVHPGSGSPVKNWSGFGALAERWLDEVGRDGCVVALSGPAENDVRFGWTDRVLPVSGLSLPRAAALLAAADAYVGNDSGISHLAGAVGARGIALFGPSDPEVWAPRASTMRVVRASRPCATCGPEILCTHRLDVDTVTAAVAGLQSV